MKRLFLFLLMLTTFAPYAYASPCGDAEPETLYTFNPALGEVPENVAVGKHGDVFVSMLLTATVAKFDKHLNRTDFPLPLPPGPPGSSFTAGLVYNRGDDLLYVTTASPAPGGTAVWELDPNTGAVAQYATIPGGGFTLFNGMTADDDGNLYIADSALGFVWRVPVGGGEAALWVDLHAPMDLSQPPSPTNPPGPNGIKFGPRGDLFVSISSQSRIVRVEMKRDGTAGAVSTYADGPDITADEFAFDRRGVLYLATEPSNSVLAIYPDDPQHHREVIADASDGLANTTAVAFGRNMGDRDELFITNGPPPGYPGLPTLMKVRVDGRGLPLASW